MSGPRPPVHRSVKPNDLEQVINALGLSDPDAWDFIMIGDGSGSTWFKPCGWACALIDSDSSWHINCGMQLRGSVNVAELRPYLETALWYSRTIGKDRLEQLYKAQPAIPHILRCHIITDCESIAHQGNGEMATKTNPEMWLAFNAIRRLGYDFRFHWMARSTMQLNRMCDELSRELRQRIVAMERAFDKVVIPGDIKVLDTPKT